MSVYEYQAFNRHGIPVKGEMECPDEIHLLNRLTGMDYIVSSIKEKKGGFLARSLSALGYSGSKFKKLDLIVFTRQIASLLDAGIPISTALKLLSEQADSKSLSELADGIRNDLEGGSTLSEALERKRECFADSYISMIHAGETAGMLPEVFARLATLEEVEHERRQNVKSAITYPIILVFAAIAGIVFLLVGVFPRFVVIFSKANVTLPWTTRSLIGLSNFVREYAVFIIVFAAAVILFIKAYKNTERGKMVIDGLKLRLPLFGSLFRKAIMSSFAYTYGALNISGIPLAKTLEILSKTVGNAVVGRAIMEVRGKIREGATIAKPFEESGAFPPLVVHMISVGEESGRMDEMLSKVSEYYEKEVKYTISKLTSMIEPALIAIMGFIVGFMYLSLITPMLQLMKVVRSGGLG